MKYLTLKITFYASVSIGSKVLFIKNYMQRLNGNLECQITPKRGPDMKKTVGILQKVKGLFNNPGIFQIGHEMTELAPHK